MFVRSARFESVDPERIDGLVAEIRESLGGEMPPGLEAAKRVVLLVDRDRGVMQNLIYCDTKADLEAVHAALDAMSPGEDGPKRTSAELYEVALDQSVGS